MELRYIIASLERLAPGEAVAYGFGRAYSYRGDYSQVSFEPLRNTTVGDMLAEARSVVGHTYEGWKGGSYTMDELTTCYLAIHGDTGPELTAELLSWMMGRPIGYEHYWHAAKWAR